MAVREDASKLLLLMANYHMPDDPDSKGYCEFDRQELMQSLHLTPYQIIDAAKFLENRGYVSLMQFLGGNFHISLTAEGRDFVEANQVDKGAIDIQRELRILFLSANPEVPFLSLDEEAREIETKIRASEYRSNVKFITKWAVRPDDLLQALNEVRPHIVHYSGHSDTDGTLALHGADGNLREVNPDNVKFLFQTMKDNIRMVLLNSCNSAQLAEAITEYIDCSIGMPSVIHDKAARYFAASFYRAVGFGRTVRNAFDQGVAALGLEGIKPEQMPKLFSRHGVDIASLRLIESQ